MCKSFGLTLLGKFIKILCPLNYISSVSAVSQNSEYHRGAQRSLLRGKHCCRLFLPISPVKLLKLEGERESSYLVVMKGSEREGVGVGEREGGVLVGKTDCAAAVVLR